MIKKRNMKLINKFKDFNFDYNLIENCADKFSLHEDIIKTIIAKGFDTEEKIAKFLNPNENDLYNPFLLNDMQKAVDRINLAIERGENILIYGDYDVDGICATSVLMMSLLKRTENVNYFLPDRSNFGYGLSEKSIEVVLEEYNPDLIITVDCGITNISQVEYVFDLGVDIIVTDHHEPGEELPNCLCVNPKLNNYPFRDLSGCGVAFKLVNALENKVDISYLDIVAISTIADLMPLVDENRFIVKKGLEILNKTRRRCVSVLLDACSVKGDIGETTIGFTLAPKINALGRLSNPMQAVILFLTDNEEVMKEITDVLLNENTKRQKLTTDFLDIADNIIKRDRLFDKKCILVHSEKFSSGISGLVASNLTNTYNRPSIVFTENGEFLIGSARSIDGINIFELLNSVKEDLIVKFGGHSGAAGVTIYKDDFDEFSRRLEEKLDQIDYSVFENTINYDIDITDKKVDIDYVLGFKALAPFGVQNEKPVFIQRINSVTPQILKGKNHIKFKVNNVDFVYFNGGKHVELFKENSNKVVAFDLNINTFNGIKSVNGKINGLYADMIDDYKNDYKSFNEFVFLNNYKADLIEEEKWTKKLDESLKNPFSTLIIVNNREAYNYFTNNILNSLENKENIFSIEYQTVPKNNLNTLMVYPDILSSFNSFSNIFIVGMPYSTGYLHRLKDLNIFVLDKKFYTNISKLDLSRECFGKYYLMLKRNVRALQGDLNDIFNVLIKNNEDININQLSACYLVFSDLKLVVENLGGIYSIPENMKVDLNSSKIYTSLIRIKEKLS